MSPISNANKKQYTKVLYCKWKLTLYVWSRFNQFKHRCICQRSDVPKRDNSIIYQRIPPRIITQTNLYMALEQPNQRLKLIRKKSSHTQWRFTLQIFQFRRNSITKQFKILSNSFADILQNELILIITNISVKTSISQFDICCFSCH